MSNFYERSTIVHEHLRGKIGIVNKMPIESQDDLSIAYTPGVAGPCRKIAENGALARELTIKRNTVAVVTDGSAVLGLGNIGPLAALPVMEGKALLFKEFANIDAWPICLDTQNADEIIKTVRRIAPGFGGINLEDISAPRCFEVENSLQDLGIPVFHDDQHGTRRAPPARNYCAALMSPTTPGHRARIWSSATRAERFIPVARGCRRKNRPCSIIPIAKATLAASTKS